VLLLFRDSTMVVELVVDRFEAAFRDREQDQI